jgi:hypothetical protein
MKMRVWGQVSHIDTSWDVPQEEDEKKRERKMKIRGRGR